MTMSRRDRILKAVQKVRGSSMAELRERAGQAIAAQLEYRGLSSAGREPDDRALHALLDAGVTGGDDSIEQLHARFTGRSSPPFFPGVRDGSSAVEMGTPRWADARRALLETADAIVAGRFDLLGFRNLSFGDPIDWHLDPTSGRRAPLEHWSRIPSSVYLDATAIGDHKVIWEINRHQHFMVLGRAFQVTGRLIYAEIFADQLAGWMEANPPKRGVNWASSLEVAYRAIAWLWALELFRGASALTPDLLARALKFLYLHGRHLERHLSTYFSPNTHLTGEALGLVYLGAMVPEFRRSSRWREQGWRILERELTAQTHPDGVYFEQTTYYHRYTADIYLHAIGVAELAGMTVPPTMRDRMVLLMDHLADVTRPDGSIPLIGDDDGGRLVNLETRDLRDVRAALGIASHTLGRPELAVVAGGATEEALWMLGAEAARVIDEAARGAPPVRESALYPHGGYAIMRSGWGPDALHAVIDAGPLGALSCGHSHSDVLAIAVWAHGCPLLVDPGTFTYTVVPSERDALRHSTAHNTVTVDGESAAVPAGPFSWAVRTHGELEAWWTGGLTDRWVASHAGFERLASPATHRRSVLFVRGEYWVVLDTVLTDGEHESVAHYHGAMGAVVTSLSDRSAWMEACCASGTSGLFFAVAGDVESVRWGQGWVSPAYGVRKRGPEARVTSRGRGRRDLITVLCPAREPGTISVSELATDRGRGVVIDRHGKRDVLLFDTAGAGSGTTGMSMDGDAALIRRASTDGAVEGIALFGERARLVIDGLTVEGDGAVEAVRDAAGSWVLVGAGRVVPVDRALAEL